MSSRWMRRFKAFDNRVSLRYWSSLSWWMPWRELVCWPTHTDDDIVIARLPVVTRSAVGNTAMSQCFGLLHPTIPGLKVVLVWIAVPFSAGSDSTSLQLFDARNDNFVEFTSQEWKYSIPYGVGSTERIKSYSFLKWTNQIIQTMMHISTEPITRSFISEVKYDNHAFQSCGSYTSPCSTWRDGMEFQRHRDWAVWFGTMLLFQFCSLSCLIRIIIVHVKVMTTLSLKTIKNLTYHQYTHHNHNFLSLSHYYSSHWHL